MPRATRLQDLNLRRFVGVRRRGDGWIGRTRRGARHLSCALAIIVFAGAAAQAQVAPYRGTGAVLDPEAYAGVPAAAPLARGDYLSAPPRMSMRQFMPQIGDQGQQGSCVGWATAYAARTLLEARDREIADRAAIRPITLSPAYVYNQIQTHGCDGGSLISDALALLQRRGTATLADFPYNPNQCGRLPGPEHHAQAAAFRIKGYARLWGSVSRNRHVSARRALAAGHPVIIGMMVGETFMRLRGDTYRPTGRDVELMRNLDMALRSGELGGHAMTLVGYDDQRNGGSFEVANSWGTDWGGNGFFWISYEDFNTFANQGYEMIPLDPPPPPRVVDMGAEVRLLHISGEPLTATAAGDRYRLRRSLPSGTRFRVEAKSDFAANIYVIGGDRGGDYGLLFPRGGTVVPHAAKGATLLLPGPTEQHFTRLNDSTGTDYYIVLIAQEPLDAGQLAQRMEMATGSVRDRLRAVLGDRLVPADEMELDGAGIGFSAASGPADVAALIVEIDHVAPDPNAGDRVPPLLVLQEPARDGFETAENPDAPIRVASRFVRIAGQAQDESAIAALVVEDALSSQFSSRGPFRAEIELPPGPGPHEVRIEARDAQDNRVSETFFFELID